MYGMVRTRVGMGHFFRVPGILLFNKLTTNGGPFLLSMDDFTAITNKIAVEAAYNKTYTVQVRRPPEPSPKRVPDMMQDTALTAKWPLSLPPPAPARWSAHPDTSQGHGAGQAHGGGRVVAGRGHCKRSGRAPYGCQQPPGGQQAPAEHRAHAQTHAVVVSYQGWPVRSPHAPIDGVGRCQIINVRYQISQTQLASDMIIIFFDVGASACVHL